MKEPSSDGVGMVTAMRLREGRLLAQCAGDGSFDAPIARQYGA